MKIGIATSSGVAKALNCLCIGISLLSCKKVNEPVEHSHAAPLVEYESIKIGMSIDQVRSILGQPGRIFQSPSDEGEAWTYYKSSEELREGFQVGGVTIFIQRGSVIKISPIMVNHRSIK